VNDRRSTRRRSLPFIRSAVLEVGDRSHVVVVTDLSADGAFLSTRIALDPSDPLRLKVILPRDGREVVIPCRLVWRSERFDPDRGRAAGIAVRFGELEEPARRLLDAYSREGLVPQADPAPADRFEYRTLERPTLDVEELNRLGLDGWELAAAWLEGEGVRLVLLRQL
jgi:PilZ domain